MNGIAAVILCAGKGTRMNDESTNKVCFPVNGVPALQRTINNMIKAGITRFVVVVGHKSEKVMECLSSYEGIAYAYQSVQNGTGNAALAGLRVLDKLGYEGPALISMGDKIISEDVISALIERYHHSRAKTVFAVQPKEFNPDGGRIVSREGRVCGIYEMTDSCILALGALENQTPDEYERTLDTLRINEKKKKKILAYANAHIGKLPSCAVLRDESFTYDEIEASRYVNTATYLCDVSLTLSAIGSLDSDNAQGEIYLTDAVNMMIRSGGVDTLPINSKEKMLTFATKEELASISKYFADKERK